MTDAHASVHAQYETNIGIEVHVQLSTQSKIFCPCANGNAQQANEHICPICTGQPGVLPVLNKHVVDYAIMAALATNSKINQTNRFARKHYFYPDLPKGFQITQSDLPICENGVVPIRLDDGTTKNIRLIRIHMEEDAGKNIHSQATDESFVDLNRAGTPLLEIVSYPDITSAAEARAYLKTLRSIVMYLNICTGNMEDGAFRADTNVSVRKKGTSKLGTRCELKNINSFKFIGDAIEHEVDRQITLLEQGGTVKQETRLWDTKEHVTVPMRGKEEAADYRYFNEPDLPEVQIDDAWISTIKAQMPELPYQKFDRLCAQGLTPYEAEILVNDLDLANFYEQAYALTKSKQLINWILRDFMALLKEQKLTIAQCKITPAHIAELVTLLESNVINNRAAQQIFETMAENGKKPEILVKELGLQQIGSSEELEAIVKEIIETNQGQVADYKAGKTKLWGFFVGQAMAKTQGRANPQQINDLLKKYLQ